MNNRLENVSIFLSQNDIVSQTICFKTAKIINELQTITFMSIKKQNDFFCREPLAGNSISTQSLKGLSYFFGNGHWSLGMEVHKISQGIWYPRDEQNKLQLYIIFWPKVCFFFFKFVVEIQLTKKIQIAPLRFLTKNCQTRCNLYLGMIEQLFKLCVLLDLPLGFFAFFTVCPG